MTGDAELDKFAALVLLPSALDVHHVTLLVEIIASRGGGSQEGAAYLHDFLVCILLGLETRRLHQSASALALILFPGAQASLVLGKLVRFDLHSLAVCALVQRGNGVVEDGHELFHDGRSHGRQ